VGKGIEPLLPEMPHVYAARDRAFEEYCIDHFGGMVFEIFHANPTRILNDRPYFRYSTNIILSGLRKVASGDRCSVRMKYIGIWIQDADLIENCRGFFDVPYRVCRSKIEGQMNGVRRVVGPTQFGELFERTGVRKIAV
jgi:hypothetical protein